jgi:RNA polymerase sigma factor for flagellar operon FliA
MTAVAAYAAVQGHSVDALVIEHQSLVRRIAYHLLARLPASVEVDDLIQAGQVGLIEAARNYRAEAGAAFATFASARIRGAMIDELRRGDWVPRSVHRRARDIAAAVSRVESRSGRDASDTEIAEELGVSLGDYHLMSQDAARGPMLSLDGMSEDGHAPEVADEQTPEQRLTDAGFRAAVATAINALPERERLVMSLYYEQELNLREIGGVLDVTESRVCQIHAQAVSRLRSRLADWTRES